MADILIRGMEMPKCCALCDLEHWDEDAYGDEMNHRCCMYRKGYTAKVRETGRLPDCPLVPLSAGHGRLIDADAFKADCLAATKEAKPDFLRHEDWLKSCAITMAFCRDIDEQLTIVPAEGGTDECSEN